VRDRAQHAEAAGLGDLDHDVAAVREGEDGHLAAEALADGSLQFVSWLSIVVSQK